MLPAPGSQLNGLKDPLQGWQAWGMLSGRGWEQGCLSLVESLPSQHFILQSREHCPGSCWLGMLLYYLGAWVQLVVSVGAKESLPTERS